MAKNVKKNVKRERRGRPRKKGLRTVRHSVNMPGSISTLTRRFAGSQSISGYVVSVLRQHFIATGHGEDLDRLEMKVNHRSSDHGENGCTAQA